jgi:hypothetical protein
VKLTVLLQRVSQISSEDQFAHLNINFGGRSVCDEERVVLDHAQRFEVDPGDISRDGLVVRIIFDRGGSDPQQKVSKSKESI